MVCRIFATRPLRKITWTKSILNGPLGMDFDMQIELFEQALVELGTDDNLVNQVLEISLEDEDALQVLRYALPKD